MQDFTKMVSIVVSTVILVSGTSVYFVNRFIREVDKSKEKFEQFTRRAHEMLEALGNRITKIETDIEWLKEGKPERRKMIDKL